LDAPGFIPKEQLPEYLARAHVFAAPSYCEGGPGFVYLEAMACGLPVIGCEGSGAAEVIEYGKTGFLVAPRDVEAAAGALRTVLNDPGQRERMSREARGYILQEAAAGVCVKRIEDFYRRVISRKESRVNNKSSVSS
jgi:glycosyltransferase involved in cell wall biosynthesis